MNEKKAVTPAKSLRHRARELAMQGVYEWRLSDKPASLIERATLAEKSIGRYDLELFCLLLRGVIGQSEALAEQLTPHLDRPVSELSPVEFSVLLVGAYELIHQPEVPYRVVINEAVELAKTFGGSDGHKFVNGVLDKLAAKVRAAEINAK
ncbi:MAG: transcription antitermination factor NusB [Sideroxydans sp.]|nr:transcription antitermination factor NusB [Sideroxydans sp.]